MPRPREPLDIIGVLTSVSKCCWSVGLPVFRLILMHSLFPWALTTVVLTLHMEASRSNSNPTSSAPRARAQKLRSDPGRPHQRPAPASQGPRRHLYWRVNVLPEALPSRVDPPSNNAGQGPATGMFTGSHGFSI